MSTFPKPEWKHLGSSSNAEFYEVQPDMLVIVPHENTKDDEKTARESIAFQDAHWRKVGRRGAAMVLMDNVLDQDSGARAVYANETHDTLTTCYALVGESFFALATASVFTGLAKPGIPTNVFRSFGEALPWIAEMNRERGSQS